MPLQALHQKERLVGAVGVAPAADVCGILVTPRGRERRDSAHAGADCLPRTSFPGRADVGTPFSAITAPETTVAT